MSRNQAKRLVEGDKIKFADGTEGVVVERSYAAIRVKWDDGEMSLYPFRDPKAPFDQLHFVKGHGGL